MFIPPRAPAHYQRLLGRLLGLVVGLAALTDVVFAATIPVPNHSFESPTTFFVTLNLDYWERTPQPESWDTNASGGWDTLIGFFKNTPPGNFDHIENCDGNQAMWLFAEPGLGLFQDYDSVDWNDPAPTHAFDARFEVGKSYQLTVGLLVGGIASGGGTRPGATVDLSLYYRAAGSNRMAVATTTITNSPLIFTNSTRLLDFSVTVPTVRATDPWAGQHIGILMLSTVTSNLTGGYWDLDNIRLTSTLTPALLNPIRINNQFQFTVASEPGMIVEILSATNAGLPMVNWTSLGLVTNVTGAIPFIDTTAHFAQRFYRARQWP